MNAVKFLEAQHILSRPPNMEEDECNAAHVAVGTYEGKYRTFVTCWEPTEEERAAIASGANVYLHLLGQTMQPAMLSTEIEVELEAGE